MESSPENPIPVEERYRIPVSAEEFDYINKLLMPIFIREERKAQQEGKSEEEFKKDNRVAKIMGPIRQQLILSNAETPNYPYLKLGEGDVKYISDEAYRGSTGNIKDMVTRKQAIENLSREFKAAKSADTVLSQKSSGKIAIVKRFFKRK